MKTSAILALLLASLLRAQTIALSTTAVTIHAPVGGPNPAPSVVILTNTGSGKLKWKATDNQPWLSVTPGHGELRTNETIDLSIKVNVGTLALGTYTGTVSISDPGATNSPQDITVTLHVNGPPRIGLSPSTLSFAAPVSGPDPASKTVTIQNTGGGTLDWTSSFSPSWLTGSPSSGTLTAGASQDVTLSVNVAGLSSGTHNGTMTVTATGASNSPQTGGVTLTLSATPTIGLTPPTLAFDAAQGGTAPPSKALSLTNVGGGTLNWTAAATASWLGVAPTSGGLSGGLSQALTVTVDPTGLVEGIYSASVTITAPGASNTPRSTTVTLNVNVVPKIGVNPKTLSFSAATDTGTSAPSALSVTNAGSGTLLWTAAAADSWLSVDPVGGSVAALDSQPLLLSVNAAGMAPGHYTTTIQFDDPAASNSPQTVAVDLTVTPSALPSHAPAGQCGLSGLELLLLLALRRGGLAWRSR